MRKLAALVLSLFLTSGVAFADTPKDADAPAPKASEPAKSKAAAKKATKTDAEIAAELESLKQAMQAQQEELELLKEELSKRDKQIDEAREAAAAANARATEASTKAGEAENTSAEVKSSEATLASNVTDLKSSNAALTTTVNTVAATTNAGGKGGQNSEEPAAIRFKGITLTAGGFVAAESVTRSRATSSDINTPFNSIPYPGNALSQVNESNFTARQSRLSLLAEGRYEAVKLTGYYEADWLGPGVTSNNRQSNSHALPQRQIWGQAKTDSGWGFTRGRPGSLG